MPDHTNSGSFKKGIVPRNKGKTASTDERIKIYTMKGAITKKGQIPWNKEKKGIYSQEVIERNKLAHLGKHLSEEQKQKISEAGKGRIVSQETRNKISIAKLGRKRPELSERTKGKSNPMYGKIPWNKGLKGVQVSTKKDKRYEDMYGVIKAKEIKQKFSKIHKGQQAWNKGLSPTEETLKKMSAGRIGVILPKKDTSIEIIVQDALRNLNIPFIKHYAIKLGNNRYHQSDIFIEPNIIIDVDGCFWHNCKECNLKHTYLTNKNEERDERINKDLISQGYIIYRFWEHEIMVNNQ